MHTQSHGSYAFKLLKSSGFFIVRWLAIVRPIESRFPRFNHPDVAQAGRPAAGQERGTKRRLRREAGPRPRSALQIRTAVPLTLTISMEPFWPSTS